MNASAPVDLVSAASESPTEGGTLEASAGYAQTLREVGGPLMLPGIATIGVIVLGVVVLKLGRKVKADALDRAFDSIASRIGLTPEEQQAVRRAAKSAGVASPTTLLLSDRALQQAVFAFVRSGPTKDERQTLDALLRKRGVIPPPLPLKHRVSEHLLSGTKPAKPGFSAVA